MIFLFKKINIATAFIMSRKIKVPFTHTFFFSSFRDCTLPPTVDWSAKLVSSYWNRATLKQHRTPFTGKFLPRFQGTLQKSKTHAFLNLKAQVSWPLRKPDKHPCNLGLKCTSKGSPRYMIESSGERAKRCSNYTSSLCLQILQSLSYHFSGHDRHHLVWPFQITCHHTRRKIPLSIITDNL